MAKIKFPNPSKLSLVVVEVQITAQGPILKVLD
jgi:hypothetical protein